MPIDFGPTTGCYAMSPPTDLYWATVPDDLFAGSAACGRCLTVWGPNGSLVVRVVEECPSCGSSELELETAGFTALTGVSSGTFPIAFRSIECPVMGNVEWAFQSSNPFYIKLQIRNHPYGVSAMDLFYGAMWHPMTRVADNYFEGFPSPQATLPLSVRAFDIHGHLLTDSIASIDNTSPIAGGSQFPFCSGLFLDGFEPAGLAPAWSGSQPYTPPGP